MWQKRLETETIFETEKKKMDALNYKIPAKGLLLILFELGFGLKVELVGSMSLSEIFVFCYTLFYLFREPMLEEKSFKRLIFGYLLLIGAQCTSEAMVGSSTTSSLKGIAITVISFCHLYFLINAFKSSRHMLPWAFIGMLIRPMIMGTDFDGNTIDALNGMNVAYLKFVIAPLILNLLMLFCYFRDNIRTSLLLLAVGSFFLLLGARSWGGVAFLSGIISIVITAFKRIRFRYIFVLLCAASAITFNSYTYYVDRVLKGKISGGNSGQILRADNPYNPINLLKVGRTETFIGTIAFLDAPLWGHGAWKKDSDYGFKYTKMKSYYQNLNEKVYEDDVDLVPCHSILVGFGCYNGIFAFIAGGLLLGAFFYMGLHNIFVTRRYIIISTYFLIIFAWHSLFSPQSNFRLTHPLYMAFFYVIFVYKSKELVIKPKVLSRYKVLEAIMRAEEREREFEKKESNIESEAETEADKTEQVEETNKRDYAAEFRRRHKKLI